MANAFIAYQRYIALKNHFTTSYDFFKYAGKTSVKVSTFDKRKDKFKFSKLAQRPDFEQFLLANMVKDPNQWVGDLFDEKAEFVYLDWQKRTQSLTYMFEQEVKLLDKDFNSNFIVKDGEHPPALGLYLSGQICLETLVVLDSLLSFVKKWDKDIKEHYVWPSVSTLVKKYKPFLRFDKDKMRKILLDIIS